MSGLDNNLTTDMDLNGVGGGGEDISWNGVEKVQAQEILKQVEYYFSEENLNTDVFLYGKLKGHKNSPVPIDLIHSFKKMRHFQPQSFVIDVMKTSTMLQVVNHKGKASVHRRVGFVRDEYRNRTGKGDAPPIKSKSKALNKATGFEEYYADGPIAPDVAEEEEELYAEDLPFAERIENALQRFGARRKFHPRKSDMWQKFIKFGGVATGPAAFGGGSAALDDYDKSLMETVRERATEFVAEDKYDLGPDGHWAVDFEGVAKAFLSSVAATYFTFKNLDEIEQCADLMKNFYNYIIYHNVCPEYRDDINAARRVCDVAKRELAGVAKINTDFPGEFNRACLAVFGGRWAARLDNRSWDDDSSQSQSLVDEKRTKQVLSLAFSTYGPEEWWRKGRLRKELLEEQSIVDTEVDAGFEVIEILKPTEDAHELYGDGAYGIQIVGKLICKPWTSPDPSTTFDLPTDFAEKSRPERYEFWLEQDLLEHCVTGTKIEATAHKLSTGLCIIDIVNSAYPSFHTVLLNEMLYEPGRSKKWVTPRHITREEHLEREGHLPLNHVDQPDAH